MANVDSTAVSEVEAVEELQQENASGDKKKIKKSYDSHPNLSFLLDYISPLTSAS